MSADATLEAAFNARNGNVHAELEFDELRIRWVASPPKMRELAAAMIRAADDADKQLPGGFDHGGVAS